jgi:hypothetical protein
MSTFIVNLYRYRPYSAENSAAGNINLRGPRIFYVIFSVFDYFACANISLKSITIRVNREKGKKTKQLQEKYHSWGEEGGDTRISDAYNICRGAHLIRMSYICLYTVGLKALHRTKALKGTV